MKKSIIAIGVLLALSGCATNQSGVGPFGGSQTVPYSEIQKSQAEQKELDRLMQHRLLEAAASIDSTLKLIERIEKGSNALRNEVVPNAAKAENVQHKQASPKPTQHANQYAPVGDTLNAKLKIVWKGGAGNELVAGIATQLGMEFKESGNKKKLPNMSFEAQGESAREVLGILGKVLDKDIDIIVTGKVLEIRYK